MVFWLVTSLAGVAMLIALSVIWFGYGYDVFERIGSTFFSLFIGAFAWALVMLAVFGVASATAGYPEEPTRSTSEELVALTTKDTVGGAGRGSIFGSYGYVEGKRVVSYLQKTDDGGVTMGYIDAHKVVIYELEAAADVTPYMLTHTWEATNEVFFPFEVVLNSKTTYSIYVPAGSVVEGFEVAP